MLPGLSKLTPAKRASSQSSAALFAGTVENSPEVQPRVNVIPKLSPASSRTAELPFSSEIKSSRPANDAGLEHKMRQPGVSLRAVLNRAAKSAALLGDGKLWTGLRHAASLP